MTLDFSNGQAARIQRQDIVVETRPARLVFGDDLRFKTAVPITRNLDRQFAEIALERLLALAVAGISGRVHNGIMPGMPQVFGQLGFQGPFDQGFGQLLGQAVSPIRSSGF